MDTKEYYLQLAEGILEAAITNGTAPVVPQDICVWMNSETAFNGTPKRVATMADLIKGINENNRLVQTKGVKRHRNGAYELISVELYLHSDIHSDINQDPYEYLEA